MMLRTALTALTVVTIATTVAPHAASAGAYYFDEPGQRTIPPAVPERPYDISHTDIDIDLDLDARHIHGQVRHVLTATQDAVGLEFDVAGLTITEAYLGSEPVSFDQDGPEQTVTVAASPSVQIGESAEVTLIYEGYPTLSDARLGLSIRPTRGSGGVDDVAFTMTEPNGSRRWFPCNDSPAEKASLTLTVTVPDAGSDTWVVAANGLLESEGPSPLTLADGTTTDGYAYTWVESHPISPYLTAFAAAPYVIFEPEDDGGSDVPMQFFARPSYQGSASVQWGATGHQIVAFEALFGPYPFDKYGTVEAPMPFAAMEHQTITLWQTELFGVNFDYQAVSAHELAHHWFGDMVTPLTWDDIWLNEGFATYSEALWDEDQGGKTELAQTMGDIQAVYLAFHGYDGDTSLYAPSEMFGVTTYEKGGAVLHLLRRVMGDDAFFAGLNDYLDAHAYAGATTADFKAAMEGRHGSDLSWFFDPWVFADDAPFPEVDIGMDRDGDRLTVGLIQSEEGADFVFPLPLRVTLKDDTVLETDLWVEPATAQRFLLKFPAKIKSVEVDPDHWALVLLHEQSSPLGSDCAEAIECDVSDDACRLAVPGAVCTGTAREGCGGCSTPPGQAPHPLAALMAIGWLTFRVARRRRPLVD